MAASVPPAPSSATASSPELRDYQRQAVECVHTCLARGQRRLYIELPTGTGKSVVLASLAKAALARGRVLVVGHRRELIHQLAETMTRVTGAPAGVIMAARDEIDAPVLVGSIQTLKGPRLARVLGEGRPPVALVLIDEAHHATGRNAYAKLLAQVEATCPSVAVVGCTATPYRMDKHRIQDILPTCAFVRTLADMQRDGWLCPLDWRPIALDGFDLSGLPTTRIDGEEDYATHELAEELNRVDHVRAVVAATAAVIDERQTLVFGVNVAHAQALTAEYQAQGFWAGMVWGEQPSAERAATLAAWRTGALQIVVNCAVLTEGFDFPALSALVLARPTMSPGLYSQMLGRGTRVHENKTDCLVLDVAGHTDASKTQAITLPMVLGEEPAPRQPEQRGLSVRWILDPVSQSPCAWAIDEQTGIYAAALGNDKYGALVPERDGSGLLQPYVIEKGIADMATLEPWPLREAVYYTNNLAVSGGKHIFANKHATWRTRPASRKQIAFLARLAPERAAEAEREHFDQGAVSMRIAIEVTRRALEQVGLLVNLPLPHRS
jgi:superfamily II DNA or RNA helicase